MKKSFLLLYLVSFITFVSAQEITFKFTSEHTCTYLPLDSVLIENLSLDCDTVLYYPDTIITFTYTNIIESNIVEDVFEVKQNFPNPFDSKTNIQIISPERDEFTLTIYDLLGREIISIKQTLEKGTNNFEFIGGYSNNYVLVVSSAKHLGKILMIKTGVANNISPTFKYINHSSVVYNPMIEKKSRSNFNYNIGNNLKYTGYINNENIVLEDIPVDNTNYLFSFNNSVPSQPSLISGLVNICLESTDLTYSVDAVEDISYLWAVPVGWTIVDGQNTNQINITPSNSGGTISVYAHNNCGNSVLQEIIINVSSIIPVASNNGPLCVNETVNLSVDSGVSWAWEGPDDYSSNLQNPVFEAISVSGGLYNVTLTDTYGCTFSDDTYLSVNENPTPIISSNSPVCTNESLEFSANQGLNWDWDWDWAGPNDFESSIQNNVIENPTIEDNGTYTVTVTNFLGCTGTTSIDLTVNEQPSISLSSNSPICDLETLELFTTNGTIWYWLGPNGFESNSQTPTIPNSTILNTGYYFATITDDNNCSNNDSIYVDISVPHIPIPAEHISGEHSILWKWFSANNCDGYMVNTMDDYNSAIDINTDTTFQMNNLICGDNSYSLFIWAYNSCGESNVLETNMNTQPCFVCGNTITDIDGNVYNTVQIGAQCWMSQNLKTTHYNDGEIIPNTTSSTEWSNLTSGAWCYYLNTSTYNADFGKLYNYYTIETERLCPTGWVIPQMPSLQVQIDGWGTLTEYLIANGYNYDGSTISNKIAKSLASNEYWESSTNEGAIGNDLSGNNSSGFNANPGSYRNSSGAFSPLIADGINQQTTWWAGSQKGYSLYYANKYSSPIYNTYNSKTGRSVRCMRPCQLPEEPIEGLHTSTDDQITWNWIAGANTVGYKYLLNDDINSDYTDAIDIGLSTSLSIPNLHCNTDFTIQLWAYNDCGSSEVIEFTFATTPVDCPATVTDGDGNIYNTVALDCQCWMAENLKYLPAVVPRTTESSTVPYYYVYGYNGTNVTSAKNYIIGSTNIFNTYGVLYNRSAANNACPSGWHLPTDDEWTIMSNYLAENGYNYDGSITSANETDFTKRLKIGKSMASTDYWNSSTWTGGIGNDMSLNNQSGLNMRPAGYRWAATDQFESLKSATYFWTASSYWMRSLLFDSTSLGRSEDIPENGYSVRCVKNN